MKKLYIIAMLLIAVSARSQIKSATLQASGLTCAMCSKAVYNALSKVGFVEKVNPDIERSSYEISFKPNASIDLDALSKAVTDAGFSVSKLQVVTAFSNAKIQNDAHLALGNQSFHFLSVTPQTLNGVKTVTLLDRNFVSAKEYKKNSRLTTLRCYVTGTMNGQRIYHVTL